MKSSPTLRRAAATELLRRRRGRRRLLDFTNYTFPQYRAEAAHTLLAEALDRVVSGELGRLMVFAPPQHGKSELVSVRLPAYWLGRRPDDPVIIASYAAALAHDKGRQAREVLRDDAYRRLFPAVAVRPDNHAVQHWRLAGQRGYCLAVGVGGPITGHGARLGVIDDPFENWAQAQSATYRDAAWDWYRTTFRTRIWEGGAIILVMTRWHQDDLAGRLLQSQGDDWTVLRLPALAESQAERDANDAYLGLATGQPDPLGRAAGEPLCPGRFSAQALARLQRDVGSLGWTAEYQGCPRPLEGGYFKRDWFEVIESAPRRIAAVRYWDNAATAGGGDWTAGVKIGRDGQGVWYVLDVVRGQWSTGERERVKRQTAQRDGADVAIFVEQEGGSSGKDAALASIRNLQGFAAYAEHPTGDKLVRGEPFRAQCEARNVKLVRGGWNTAYLDELCAIPNGLHDDQFDAGAGAFNALARRGAAQIEVGSIELW